MSADLLAEFGGGPAPAAPEQSTREQHRESQDTSTSLFGDFEPADDLNYARPPVQRESPETEQWSDFHSAEAPEPSTQAQAQDEELWHQDDFGNDVLFDATTEEAPEEVPEDDNWGEFESADSTVQEKQVDYPPKRQSTDPTQKTQKQATVPIRNQNIAFGAQNSVDLLSDIDSGPALNPTIAVPAKHTLDRRGSNNSSHTRKLSSIDHSTPKLPDLDDEWGDFADAAPDAPSATLEGAFDQIGIGEPKPTRSQTRLSSDRSKPQSVQTKAAPVTSVDIRPVNIPPPFVILQVFAPLFEQFQKQAAAAKSATADSKQKSVPSDSILADDLVSTLKVAARIIAGRTLRWKRDTALSQSTKIGPARSGKSGGMKLSSVNKSESVKEEKEAMDVLDTWRSRAGVFNSVILAAGYQVPLISNSMHARPANADEGALKAAHACALCGLKREERIPKIDEKVEDSFGEWWTEHWGHTDCKSFWDKRISVCKVLRNVVNPSRRICVESVPKGEEAWREVAGWKTIRASLEDLRQTDPSFQGFSERDDPEDCILP